MLPIRDSVPCHRPPPAALAVIVLNAAIFLVQLTLSPAQEAWAITEFALVPARYTHPDWAIAHGLNPHDYLPFLSSIFMHGGWLHIALNMWTLWIFGCALEAKLGAAKFVLFYLLCGVAASVTHVQFNAASTVPVLGASGAVAGVVSAYATTFPHARVVLLVPILFLPLFFEVPALAFAGVWFALQVLQGAFELLAPGFAGGIAWWAHIGGFVAGAVLVRVLVRGKARARGPWGS